MFLTVKTDDVTKGRKDVDPHGRFRGEWVNRVVSFERHNKLNQIRSRANIRGV